jgi:YVTN family beta-propeller protein
MRSFNKQIFSGFCLIILSLLFTGGVFAQTVKPLKTSGYHLIKTIKIGGEGGWDYLFNDSKAHRLYVSHSSHVVVIDTDSGKIVGDIPDTKGVHGIAVADEFNRGFTSNGKDNSVTIFDTKTLKMLETVKVGANPDAIIFDPASKRIFAMNHSGSSVTAIDAKDGKVAGTIELNGKPEFAAADGKGMIFVNLEDKSEVVAIDSGKLVIKSRWSTAPGEEPTGLAMDRKNKRLFIGCSNKKMIVMDSTNGKVLADLPIGNGVDATAFDEDSKMAFSSNGEGTLTVVREDSPGNFSVVENITTQRGARTMAFDTKNQLIYLATAQFGETPAPTKEQPRPRPALIPDSFEILVFGK